MFGFFKKNKRARDEAVSKLRESARESVSAGQALTQEHKSLYSLHGSLDQKHGQLISLIKENDETRKLLSKRESTLRVEESKSADRSAEVRKQEIWLETRKSEIRKQESNVERRDKSLEQERKDIKKREIAAQKLADTAQAESETIKTREQKIEQQEKDLSVRIEEVEAREKSAEATFETAEARDSELAEKERAFEQERTEILNNLTEKMEEYESKLAAIKEAGNVIDAKKFNDSKEGKDAKIVVSEAIKQAKKNLADGVQAFEELQEKYCQGTFHGFAIPVSILDKKLKSLREYTKQIKEHALGNDFMQPLVDTIETHLLEAGKCNKKWEFSESYYHICSGLAVCKNYELLLTIINDYVNNSGEYSNNEESQEPDYYEILGVSEKASEAEIKKAYKKMASQYHPDRAPKGKEEEYGEKMKDINKAMKFLLDKAKRDEYNKRRSKK